MKRRDWLLTGGVAAAAVAAGAAWSWRQNRGGSVNTDVATGALWAQRFDQPAGGELAMAPLRGRPTVLNFWATWCAPCVKEMPMLDAFYQRHRAAGWQVVGLAVDGPTPVREFLAKLPMTFPIGLAGLNGVDLARSLGNERGGLPFSVIFDRRGDAVFRKLGVLTEDELAGWVQKLS